MQRRKFIGFLGGLLVVSSDSAGAVIPGKLDRIALVSPGGLVAESSQNGKLLLGALAQLGYVVGQNLAFEGPRGTSPLPVPLPQVMEELKASKVDLIVAWGYPTALAAKIAGIPTIVAFGVGDPVATSLVANLARPGGSITGISDVATTLSTKRLGLLKELLPKLNRVAMLWNKDDLGMSLRYEASAKAAQAMGVEVQAVGVREPDDFNEAFAVMDREPPDAILMVSGLAHRSQPQARIRICRHASLAGDLRVRPNGSRGRLDVLWARFTRIVRTRCRNGGSYS